MIRSSVLAITMVAALVGCGDGESAESTTTESPAADQQSEDVVNDLVVCMTYSGLEVATRAAFAGGTERTSITAQMVEVGPKGDPEATVLVPEAEQVARIASDSRLVSLFGEPIAERVFVTGAPPLEVIKSGQPADVPPAILEVVAGCLS